MNNEQERHDKGEGARTLAERVRARRQELGYSQARFARLVGKSTQQVKLVESGRTHNIYGSTLMAYSRVLNVPPEWITQGIEIGKEQPETDPEVWLRQNLGLRNADHIETILEMRRRLQRLEELEADR